MKAVIFMLAVLTAMNIQGQRHITFGVKAGLNLADIAFGGEGRPVHRSKSSINAGGFAHIYLKRNISLKTELLYSGQGSIVQVDHGNDVMPQYEDYKWILPYINLPVMVQYEPIKNLGLETGLQLGKLLNGTINTGFEEISIKDDLRSFDLSWNIGASYTSKLGLGIGGRYCMGLSSISKTKEYPYKNRVLQFYLLYAIKK